MRKFDSSYLFCSFFLCLFISGCNETTGNDYFTAGVSLGGSGTGGGAQKPGEGKPDQLIEDDVAYEVVYTDPVTQTCGEIERTIQFIDIWNKSEVKRAGERQELFSLTSLDPSRLAVQVVIKNTSASPVYEYIDSCRPLVQLTGTQGYSNQRTASLQLSQKEDKRQDDDQPASLCLNEQTVQVYQPDETRQYQYIFSLPNINQQWVLGYESQYGVDAFYNASLYRRTQCEAIKINLEMEKIILPQTENLSFGF